MSRPTRLNVLIVPSDGSRSLRVNLPGWIFSALAVASVVAATALCVLIVDYLRVRELARDPAALKRQVTAQQGEIDGFRKRVWERVALDSRYDSDLEFGLSRAVEFQRAGR